MPDMLAIDWEKTENEAVEILRTLVSIDTSNPPGNESAAVGYIKGLLEQEGLKPVVVEQHPGRSNMVVRIEGAGRGPSLMLDSHLDVVGADPAEWKVPPFSAEIRDGFIWGRGTLDMKAMTAMSMAVVLAVARNSIPLAGDLVLTAAADEEDGAGKGAFFLVNEHPELIKADYALGEVGGMNFNVNGKRIYPVQVAEKGLCWLRLAVSGKGGHGSVPRKNSVPQKVARLLKILSDTRFPIAPHSAARAFLETMAQASPGFSRVVLKLIRGGKGSSFLLDHIVPDDRAASLRALLSHTCQASVVECGDKINVIPSSGAVLVDCRILPGTSPEEMKRMIERRVGNLAEVELMKGHRGHATSPDNPLFRQIEKTMSVMDPGGIVTPYLMPGFTNGGAYSRLGIKYMGFTPIMMPPTLDFSNMFHAPDERCPVDGFKWGVRTLYEVVAGFVFEKQT